MSVLLYPRGPLVLAVLLTVGLASASGQGYRTVKIASVGISITINKRLKGLPLRLDSMDPHLRARFRTADRRDYVKLKGGGRFEWFTDVFEFGASKDPQTPGRDGTGSNAPPKTAQERAEAEMRARAIRRAAAANFEQWVARMKPSMVTKGKLVKRKGSKLPYKFWEFLTDTNSADYQWYHGAAVYKIEEREVAVLVRMPLRQGERPTPAVNKMVRYILASGRLLKDGDSDLKDSSSKDRFADTSEKKAALETAKKNIQGLSTWSYFTTSSYIVLYSWESGQKGKSYNVAKRLSASLEKMRALYKKYYPPAKNVKMPYSVFRVCGTYEQFQKYGGSPRGVVGWFSPTSKELVVFQGGDSGMRKKGYLETVTHHEGWHQYSDAFFGGVELHRWFDEGHGDWFGAHVPRGSSFSYIGSPMRYKWVKLMVKKGDFVPFEKIVAWPRSKFYGSSRSAYYYAQAYGMVDFLRKGHAMGKKTFDASWSEILPTYRKTVLEAGDADIATKKAFAGVDFVKMTAAWKRWVNSSRFKKPR